MVDEAATSPNGVSMVSYKVDGKSILHTKSTKAVQLVCTISTSTSDDMWVMNCDVVIDEVPTRKLFISYSVRMENGKSKVYHTSMFSGNLLQQNGLM